MADAPVYEFTTTAEDRAVSLYQDILVLPIPLDVRTVFGTGGTFRVHCELNGYRTQRGLIPDGNGQHLIWLGRDLAKAAGIQLNQTVHVRLWPADPNAVNLPPELEAALEQDEAAATRFRTFTPGRQRGLCKYISDAKTEPTRIKRSLEICHKLRTYTLYGDLEQQRKAGR